MYVILPHMIMSFYLAMGRVKTMCHNNSMATLNTVMVIPKLRDLTHYVISLETTSSSQSGVR